MYQTNTAFRFQNTFILIGTGEKSRVFTVVSTELCYEQISGFGKSKCSGMTIKQNITRTGLS